MAVLGKLFKEVIKKQVPKKTVQQTEQLDDNVLKQQIKDIEEQDIKIVDPKSNTEKLVDTDLPSADTTSVVSKKPDEKTISVFPKPERMFPEESRPKGGEYLNPATGEVLSGRNVSSAKLSISPEGVPSFKVSNDNVEKVGSVGKGKTQIKTNLFKKKAGWKWTKAPEGMEDIKTLISVENKGKHFYTIETDFSKGVNLKKYPNQKTEPRLRPTVVGEIELGPQIGTISVRGREHPVYQNIRTFNEGGTVMKEQMEMAFMQDGGLQDEGGTIDKESGNEVPSGSLKKEVRDDIPAMLSEGEFVFPADVVRFIGLNKLMQMRQEAKMGLKLMEKMGQMGNSEEAEIPDDLPFGVTDIIVMESDKKEKKDDKKEMSEGGVLTASNGTDVVSTRDKNKFYKKNYLDADGNKVEVTVDYLDRPISNKLDIVKGKLTPAPPEQEEEDTDLDEGVSEGMSGIFYKGRRLTNSEAERLKNTKGFQKQIADIGLQETINRYADTNTGRMLFESALDPEAFANEQARLKKKRRKGLTKRQERKNQQEATLANFDKSLEGLTFSERLKMAGEDIKNRIAGLPLELSEKKELINRSLDNFKKGKTLSPAVITEKPQTPLARPANIGQKTPTPITGGGFAETAGSVPGPLSTQTTTTFNPLAQGSPGPLTPAPFVGKLPRTIPGSFTPPTNYGENLTLTPNYGEDLTLTPNYGEDLTLTPNYGEDLTLAPPPPKETRKEKRGDRRYRQQTSSEKNKKFAAQNIIDYIRRLFPDNKELQNDLLEETFKYYDEGIGVTKPNKITPQDLGRFKKGGLMKRKY